MIRSTHTLDSVIRLGPEYSRLLNDFGFDTCCGGHQTLQQNADALGIDLTQALSQLNALESSLAK